MILMMILSDSVKYIELICFCVRDVGFFFLIFIVDIILIYKLEGDSVHVDYVF